MKQLKAPAKKPSWKSEKQVERIHFASAMVSENRRPWQGTLFMTKAGEFDGLNCLDLTQKE